jgi:hypothetical protein
VPDPVVLVLNPAVLVLNPAVLVPDPYKLLVFLAICMIFWSKTIKKTMVTNHG